MIGIGGNDFTPFHENERWKTQAEMAADYEKSYVVFVKELRRSNPNALIVMTWTSDKSSEYERSSERVFDQLKADGLTHFDKMVFPKMQRTGCMGHSNIHDDAEVARLLEALIDSHSGAW